MAIFPSGLLRKASRAPAPSSGLVQTSCCSFSHAMRFRSRESATVSVLVHRRAAALPLSGIVQASKFPRIRPTASRSAAEGKNNW